MPSVIETEKKNVKGVLKDFAIQKIDINSSNTLTFTVHNSRNLTEVITALSFINDPAIKNGTKDAIIKIVKLPFLDAYQCAIEDNIQLALDTFKLNYISEKTFIKSTQILASFSERTNSYLTEKSLAEEEKENNNFSAEKLSTHEEKENYFKPNLK